MNKRAVSPLVATVILVAFAIALGAVIMTVSAGTVDDYPDDSVCLVSSWPSDELKVLSVEYATGKISKDEFLSKVEDYR